MGAARGLHVVQIGSDDSVFARPDSEPALRQRRYGALLDETAPGSRLTCLVLTRSAAATAYERDNVAFEPVDAQRGGFRKAFLWRTVVRRLAALHARSPISVLTTQTVHDEAWAALCFGRSRGVPVVGQIHFDLFGGHALAEMSRNAVTARLRRAAILAILPRFRALRVVGTRIARDIEARGLHRDVTVLPVAVSMLERARPARRIPREARVLFVGRLCAQKNLGFWLDVARRVAAEDRGVRFDIAGDGDLRASLAGHAERQGLGGRLELHGFVPYERLGALYARASAFLLTSHSEGLGRVLLEALAHELPVVAPRMPGPEDVVVDGRSGYLVEPGDEATFAARILALLRDPELGQRLGAWGGDDVRARFDPARLARRWVDLLVTHAA